MASSSSQEIGTEPTTVDEYIDRADPAVQQRLRDVRAAVHRALPGSTERIGYKMPGITRDGKTVVWFASWKKHIALYAVPVFDGALEDEVSSRRAAKDTLQFPHRQPLPTDLIERVVREMIRVKTG